ncbi:zinc finger protein 184-like isoform X11 [Vanessa cardui]|uniref:zinc finger protein 184-like isoform X11 n=1 Tax=Vanessa cardui TaxID=171605 RepID=UPI001F13AF44|nr:zinc finger protein 184-like isoform X11 [Vanessa cardui]
MASKTTEWRPGPTVCRCCLTEGCYKDISTEYFWMGKREVYAEMLSETFDLSIAYSQSGGPNSHSRLICEPCISRLRDAADFKRQVQECERTFMQYLDPGSSLADLEVGVDLDKEVKVERVKEEKEQSDDDEFDDRPDFGDDDDYDDLDDQPLTKLASKVPKKESVDVLDLIDNAKVTVKRKSSSKTKVTPAKKAKTKKDIASSSKEKPEPRKKKEVDWLVTARLNAKLVLRYSTAYPFRIPSNSMVCVYCCEQYDDPKQYRMHVKQEHDDFNVDTAFAHSSNNYSEYLKVDCLDLACRICMEPCDTISSMAQHLVEDHGKDINLKIEVGMQMFKLGPEKWVCALCNLKLPSLRELSRHTSCHYHKYTCEACGKSYINKENLTRHMQFSHSEYKICLKCKKSFASCEERRVHVLSSERCWPQSCNICGKRFISRKLRTEHLSEVHGQKPKNYKCPDCGKVFDKWHPYRAHFILSHTDDNFSCSFCGLKFDTKRALLEHKVIHTKEKSFSCNICSKSFARKKNLIQHSWIHSEFKRFQCNICSKQFNQRVSWKTHMKSYHPELVNL